METNEYEKPEVTDYGALADVTEATGFTGSEDGGSKQDVHHSLP